MADLTYAQLISRITGRLNRDDLDNQSSSPTVDLARNAIQAVILHYQRELFYPAEATDTSKTCTIGNKWVDLPSGWQDVSTIRILQNSTIWIPLDRVRYDSILEQDNLYTSVQSLPAVWAPYNDPVGGARAIRLFPVPNLAYPLEFTFTSPPAAPASDSTVNFWTTDAQEMCIEGAIAHLCDTYLNNPVRAAKAKERELEEFLSLNSKTIRALGGIRTVPYL